MKYNIKTTSDFDKVPDSPWKEYIISLVRGNLQIGEMRTMVTEIEMDDGLNAHGRSEAFPSFTLSGVYLSGKLPTSRPELT